MKNEFDGKEYYEKLREKAEEILKKVEKEVASNGKSRVQKPQK